VLFRSRDRGVRVIPEIDLPGHSSKLCLAYPDFCALWVDSNNHTSRQLFDPTNEEAWQFAATMYGELATVFDSDEYHLGGDEVWTVPWEQSPPIVAWMQAHANGCPDNASLTCGTVDGLLHYFTRRHIALFRALHKKSIGWAPGMDGYDVGDSGDSNYTAYPDVTLDNWQGFDPNGDQYWQPAQHDFTAQRAPVILSGPYYVIDRWPSNNDGTWLSWHDMYHTDPANFTNSDAVLRQVRGGKLCAWDDAARTDSGNLASKVGLFMAAAAEAWWSPKGYIDPTAGPQDYWTQMRINQVRCRMLGYGYEFEPIEFIAVPCPREYEPAPLPFEREQPSNTHTTHSSALQP